MKITRYNNQANELYKLWLNISIDIPYTENMDIKCFKNTYLDRSVTEFDGFLAMENRSLKGAAFVHFYSGGGAVLIFFVSEDLIDTPMSEALLEKAIALCKEKDISNLSLKPMLGVPWYIDYFKKQGFVKNEKYPEGLWMKCLISEIPNFEMPDDIITHFTNDLDKTDDIQGLAKLEMDIALEEYGAEFEIQDNINSLREEMQSGNAIWGIAKANSEVIGYTKTKFTSLLSGGQIVKNQGLAVRKEHRKKGVARVLLAESMQMVKDKGHTEMYISTHSKNPARFLYEELGFETIEIVPNLLFIL